MKSKTMAVLFWCGRRRGADACDLADLGKAMQGKLHDSFL